jgi:hypothetical protein
MSSTESDSDGDNNSMNLHNGTCSDEEVMVGLQMLEAASQVQSQKKGRFICCVI